MEIVRKLPKTFYICVLNFKGGVGKTTTSTHLAYYLATILGYRVLLVDCDMQANSSSGLTKEIDGATLTNVLKGEIPLHHAIRKVRENLYLVPADYDLDTASKHIISSGMGGYTLLSRSLKAMEKGKQIPELDKKFDHSQSPLTPLNECIFDIVIFDNAGFSSTTESALYASDSILAPVEMEYFSYEGIFMMMDKLESTMASMGRELDVLGVVPYNIDERFKMTRSYSVSLKKEYEIETTVPIRTDAAVKYAQPKAQTVFEFEPTCNAAKDFKALGDQILERIKESLAEASRG